MRSVNLCWFSSDFPYPFEVLFCRAKIVVLRDCFNAHGLIALLRTSSYSLVVKDTRMNSTQLSRLYFVIIGHRDQPLFEFEAMRQDDSGGIPREDYRHLCQFVAHAALDAVEASLVGQHGNQMFFKNVDRFNEWSVSAFVTSGLVKFILLHPNREENQLRKEESDIIRNFFYAVYEIYMKMILNPFYEIDSEITSRGFRDKFQILVKKHLLNL